MKLLGRGLTLSLVLGGVLLTGCTGQSDRESAETAADHKGSRQDAHSRPAAPSAPAAEAEADTDARDQRDERTAEAPDLLSTFALDVDTASYGYARRSLADGRLPAPDTVRPEEFVNSFRQDYQRPEGNGFSVTADGARAGDSGWSLMRVGLATRADDSRPESRPPAALTFVVDVSGSMAEPGRLDLVKKSLAMMVGQLRADDSVALVTFNDEARTLLSPTRLDGDGAREEVRGAVEELEVDGSTNLGAGLTSGYEQAVEGHRENATNRVVVLSDALANTGDVDPDTLLEKIGDAREEYGITLFGVGVGSEYGDELMEELTNQGDGHTAYVSSMEESREVFVEQLPRNVELRARDAKAQVAFAADTVEDYTLVGYENREVADEDFRDDRVDGGEVGPGHTVTALYAVRLREGAEGRVATATVRWLDPKSRAPHEESGEVTVSDLDGDLWQSAPRLQVTAVAAYFADALRQSAADSDDPQVEERTEGTEDGGRPLPDAPTLRQLESRARSLATETGDGAVTELADAMAKARTLLT